MKTIHLTYCGMAGNGPTVREAKADAARKIEAVLSASYTPRLFHWRGVTALVWQTPHGVESRILPLPETPIPAHGEYLYGGSSNHDFTQVCEAMRYNLAQIGADIESDELPAIIAELPSFRHRDYFSWLGFQRAYRHAKANDYGQTDSSWHRWACEHEGDFNPTRKQAA